MRSAGQSNCSTLSAGLTTGLRVAWSARAWLEAMSVITPAAPAPTVSALAAAEAERHVPDSLLRCARISLSILVPRSRSSIELVSHSRSEHPRPGAVGVGPGVVAIDPPVFIGQVRSEQL